MAKGRGMIDLSCRSCGRRYGFTWIEGEPIPPCPHCRAMPNEKTQRDMAHVFAVEALLEKNAHGMTPCELQRARIAAGLSIGQAAKILGITVDDLERIEGGTRKLDVALAVAIDNAYWLAKQTSDPTGHER